jgi:hypothetical protein
MEEPTGNEPEDHISDDVLEQYSLDRLEEQELAAVEEHLLLCESCRDRLEGIDAFVASMRTALRDPKLTNGQSPSFPNRSLTIAGLLQRLIPSRVCEQGVISSLGQPAGRNRMSGAFRAFAAVSAAAAAVMAVAYLVPHSSDTRDPVVLELRAMRGAPPAGVAAANTPLTLRLDATALPFVTALRVEIVDHAGTTRWTGDVPFRSDVLSVQAPAMSAGMYWVRVLNPARETLREYGLTLK